MFDPFRVVMDFEAALCDYTGARYAVTTTSCTMALLLAVAWHLRTQPQHVEIYQNEPGGIHRARRVAVEIPKHTYIGVPMSIIHAGGWPVFRDADWVGAYQLRPLPVWDSARWLTSGMYGRAGYSEFSPSRLFADGGHMICLSCHWNKTLGVQQGGVILHDNPEADKWLRKARFDGRTERIEPKDDRFDVVGWHCYMAPETAAAGLVRLASLPMHNDPLPWGPGTDSDYPDLSQMEIFK